MKGIMAFCVLVFLCGCCSYAKEQQIFERGFRHGYLTGRNDESKDIDPKWFIDWMGGR